MKMKNNNIVIWKISSPIDLPINLGSYDYKGGLKR